MSKVHHYGRPLVSCVGMGALVFAISSASCADGGEGVRSNAGEDVDTALESEPVVEIESEIESEGEGGNQKVGLIQFDNTYGIKLEGGGGSEHWSVGARFSDSGWLGHEPYSPGAGHLYLKCEHKNLGHGCSSYRCTRNETPPPPVSAGDITASGGVHTRIDMSFDPNWPFYGASFDPPWGAPGLFRAGNELVVRGAGSHEVPAFDTRVRAPDELIITKPVSPPTPSDGGIPVFELDRWKPAKFEWTSPTRGKVRVEIYHRQEGFLEPESGIRCDFPASAKRGTIPLRVLRLVNRKQAWIQVRGHEETTVRAGDYDVRVMAAGEGKSPEGYLFPRDFNWR